MAAIDRIAIVRSTYSPYGGVERVALSLVEALLQSGVDVTLLTFPDQPWPIDHPRFHALPMGIFHAHRLIQAWSFERAVRRYLARNFFENIFSLDKVTVFTHLHAGGGTHKTFLGIKSAYSGVFSRLFRWMSPFHRYLLHLEKKGFENPRLVRVRCNSGMVKKDILSEYGVAEDKLAVIHSGIHWQQMGDVFADRNTVAEGLRRQHGIDPVWQCLLFLGSGFDRKGLDIAMEGLAAMPRNFHLLVVGKGKPKPYWKLAARLNLESRVHFLGPQPRGWRYASICKALVLPSRYDPFGGAAAEGQAMGIPVLVSDTTGFVDFVADGKNGVVLTGPMTGQKIKSAFEALLALIRNPVKSAEQLREGVRCLDDAAIQKRLLAEFLAL